MKLLKHITISIDYYVPEDTPSGKKDDSAPISRDAESPRKNVEINREKSVFSPSFEPVSIPSKETNLAENSRRAGFSNAKKALAWKRRQLLKVLDEVLRKQFQAEGVPREVDNREYGRGPENGLRKEAGNTSGYTFYPEPCHNLKNVSKKTTPSTRNK